MKNNKINKIVISPTPEDSGAPVVNSKKVVKYFQARKQGKNKTQSAIEAGYNPAHTSRIEATRNYQKLESYWKEILLNELPYQDMAKILKRNAMQERDIGGSNGAIKLALEKLNSTYGGDESEKVVVILKQRDEDENYN
jgi:phage terminase small subunit